MLAGWGLRVILLDQTWYLIYLGCGLGIWQSAHQAAAKTILHGPQLF